MKWLRITLILFALSGLGIGYWYHQAEAHSAVTYRTATVERGTLSSTISATGTIEPEEVVDVGAQVAGMIKNFGPDPRDSTKTIDYGTPVEEGTVLAQIDAALYKSQVDQATANLQRSEADLIQMQAKVEQTERDWQRAQYLNTSRGAIAPVDFDTAKATAETAKSALGVGQATVAQNKAALQQAEINLSYCTIKSPVKGVIIDRRVNIGQTVVASLNAPSLFLIAKDLTRLQIWASVNEADIGQIHEGQPVRFTVDAHPNDVFEGTVTQIRLNAAMTQNVVTYTVVVSTDNSHGKLLPYLTANLQFEVDQHKDVKMVANGALRWRPQLEQVAPDARANFARALEKKVAAGAEKDHANRGTVWVLDGEFVRPVKVKIGLSDGVRTEIVDGAVDENTAVVLGTAQAPTAANDGASPFTPQPFNRRTAS